jgi:hypothetical protein
VAYIQRQFQPVYIGSKPDAVLFHHIAGSTYRSSSVVSMFNHVVTGSGNDETSCRTNVESVLAVATGAYNINGFVCMQIYRLPHFQQCFPESTEFIYRDIPHQKDRNQTGNLCVVVLALRDLLQDLSGFFFPEVLMFEKSV